MSATNSDAVCSAIRRAYPWPEYVAMFEVADATGFAGSGRADAVVMGTWPSRGLLLHGMEIKVSRSDWLRELKNPAKAESFANRCDQWSLIAGDDSVAKLAEIPSPWGFAVLEKGKFKWVKQPERLTPIAMDRKFLASIMRACENTHGIAAKKEAVINDEIRALNAKFEARVTERVRQTAEHNNRELRELQQRVKAFEEKSGVKIDRWHMDDVAHAVSIVLALGRDGVLAHARGVRAALDKLIAEAPKLPSDALTEREAA